MHSRLPAAALVILAVLSTEAQGQPLPPQPVGAPLFREPAPIATGFSVAEKYVRVDTDQRSVTGWYPLFKTNVTGDGWISLGSGYRVPVFGRRAFVDGSAAYSWRGYKVADLSFEVPNIGGSRLSLGTLVHWQDLTQVQYFGAGQDSIPLHTDYGLSTAEVLGFANFRALDTLSFEARVGRVSRPNLSPSSGPFDRSYPDSALMFSHEPGFDQIGQPGFLFTHFSAGADTRDHVGHPTRGGVYRAVAAIYSDRDDGRFSFRRYELEGAQFVPLSPNRWTLAFHGWSVFSDTTGSSSIPSYMLPSLGGSTTLRSFADYRFHDRHMLLASVESRWALFEHIDAAVFADAGGVASRVGDLGLKEMSIGAGVRVHVRSTTIGRLDVAHGREGWRVLLRVNDPFRLNRLARRSAAIPFVP